MEHSSKVVVVAGATGSLGSSLALAAASMKCRVALMARSKDKLEQLAYAVRGRGGEAIPLVTDAQNPVLVGEAYEHIVDKWTTIDIVINCVGVVEPIGLVWQCSEDDLSASLQTNVQAMYVINRQAVLRMRKQASGTIVNITSGAGRKPYRGWSAYCSQKAAMDMFTRCIAAELEHESVRIFALSPGPFEGHMQEIIRRTSEESFPQREKFIKYYESGALADPDELGHIILEISLTDWPELSGTIADLRSDDFRTACAEHGVTFEYPGGLSRR
jgi:benzil reductase ((S)-benzoin forming)